MVILYMSRRRSTFTVLALAIISLAMFPLPIGMNSMGTPLENQSRAIEDPLWASLQLWGDTKPLYSAAIGDVDPFTEGNELVVGGESNRLTVISGHERSWSASTVFTDEWYIHAIEVGDVDKDHPGDEVLCAGRSDKVTLIQRIGQSWVPEVLWNSKDWIYNLALADLDPNYKGNEIIVIGDNNKVTMLVNDGGTWSNRTLWTDTDSLDALVVADIDTSVNGSEILVSGASKKVTLLSSENGTWVQNTIWTAADQPISMTSGNIVEDIPGNEIAVVGTRGDVTILWWNGTEWMNSTIWQDRKTLYDVKMGDFTDLHPGEELAVCGWSGNVTVIWEEPGSGCNTSEPAEECFTKVRILENNAYVLGLAIGEFDPYHSGNEIAAVGFNGWVVKCQQEPPGFDLFASPLAQKVPAGSDALFWLQLISRGGFASPVNLDVVGAPAGWEGSFSVDSLTPTAQASISFSIPLDTSTGQYEVEVKGTSGTYERSLEMIISVEPPGTPDFSLEVIPSHQTTTADYPAMYSIGLEPKNGFNSRVNLSVTGLVMGMVPSFVSYSVIPPDSTFLEIATSAITLPGTYHLLVIGDSNGLVRTFGISLEVLATGTGDFVLDMGLRAVSMAENESKDVTINVQSIFGFTEKVSLEVVNLPAGVKAIFFPDTVIPTDNATLNLTGGKDMNIGSYEVIIRGVGGGIVHETVFILNIITPSPKFTLQVTPSSCLVNTSDYCTFYIMVIPQEGFTSPVFIEVSNLPPFSTSQISPESIMPGEAATLTIDIGGDTPEDGYNITIEGEGGGKSDSESVTVTVTKPAFDESDDEEIPYLYLMAVGLVIIFVIMFILAGIRYRTVSGKEETDPKRLEREGEEDWKWKERKGMETEVDGRLVFKQDQVEDEVGQKEDDDEVGKEKKEEEEDEDRPHEKRLNEKKKRAAKKEL